MDCNTPGFPVHFQLPEFTQTHVHLVSGTIQPSHPLSSLSPSAFILSQYQALFFFFLFLLNFILIFNFTILCWFCHISTWIHHRYTRVPHPEPSSLLPPPSPDHPSGSRYWMLGAGALGRPRLFFKESVLPSDGQSIGVSASASVFPMNIQDWYPLGLTGWISLKSRGLSRVFSNTTVQKH